MDLVETTLLDAGVSPDQILIERFVTPDQPRGDAPARRARRAPTTTAPGCPRRW